MFKTRLQKTTAAVTILGIVGIVALLRILNSFSEMPPAHTFIVTGPDSYVQTTGTPDPPSRWVGVLVDTPTPTPTANYTDTCPLGYANSFTAGAVACWNPYGYREDTNAAPYYGQSILCKDDADTDWSGNYVGGALVIPQASWTITRVEALLGYSSADGAPQYPVTLSIYEASDTSGGAFDYELPGALIAQTSDASGDLCAIQFPERIYGCIPSFVISPTVTLTNTAGYWFLFDFDVTGSGGCLDIANIGSAWHANTALANGNPQPIPGWTGWLVDCDYADVDGFYCRGGTYNTANYQFPIALYGESGATTPTPAPPAPTATPFFAIPTVSVPQSTPHQQTQRVITDEDTFICETEPDTNFGNSSVLALNEYCKILIRWPSLRGIFFGQTVISATLRLFVLAQPVTSDGSTTFSAHVVYPQWREFTPTWNVSMPGVSWGSPGASTVNVDYAASSSGAMPVTGSTFGWIDVPLNVTTVNNWISGAVGNYGVIIRSADVNNDLRLTSSEWYDEGFRPQLILTTLSSTPTPTPAP